MLELDLDREVVRDGHVQHADADVQEGGGVHQVQGGLRVAAVGLRREALERVRRVRPDEAEWERCRLVPGLHQALVGLSAGRGLGGINVEVAEDDQVAELLELHEVTQS